MDKKLDMLSKDVNSTKHYSMSYENYKLSINDKTINIAQSSNQHDLCAVIFADKDNMLKTWDVFSLDEALEIRLDCEGWKGKIYSTARHLNTKIQKETGLSDFFKYTKKTVKINPKYLSFN